MEKMRDMTWEELSEEQQCQISDAWRCIKGVPLVSRIPMKTDTTIKEGCIRAATILGYLPQVDARSIAERVAETLIKKVEGENAGTFEVSDGRKLVKCRVWTCPCSMDEGIENIKAMIAAAIQSAIDQDRAAKGVGNV